MPRCVRRREAVGDLLRDVADALDGTGVRRVDELREALPSRNSITK